MVFFIGQEKPHFSLDILIVIVMDVMMTWKTLLSAYVFSLDSGICSWSSKKQNSYTIICRSIKCCSNQKATTQAIWLRIIFEDVEEKRKHANILYCANKSTVSIGKNQVNHDHTKHIVDNYHFIRHIIEKGEAQLQCCKSEELADIIIKALSKEKLYYLKELIEVAKKAH